MNIHKNYIIAVFLGCFFGTQAYASNKLIKETEWPTCRNLIVIVSGEILQDYFVRLGQLAIDHGLLEGCNHIFIEGNGWLRCQFEQDPFHGPDVVFAFKNRTDSQIVRIRVQQNFCLFEAGAITVTPINGQWEYTTTEGSMRDSQPGEVWLDSVLNN